MKRSKCFWCLLMVLLVVVACQNQQNTSGASKSVNLEGFTVEKLKGAPNVNYVYKRDAENRLLEEGFMQNGQKTGVWTTYDPEKGTVLSLTSYLAGQLNGRSLTLDNNNRLEAQQGYKNGQLHGYAAKYKFSRTLEEFNYENGQLEGTYKKYFDSANQVQQEANYKAGKLDGAVKYYNKDGEMTLEYQYKNGEKISGGILKE
ncbi:MAG: hypothetical protein AAF738_09880 [Bacteroidota bacterium]